jgi:LmbE family N-acetylglucosaminyl deacetylase
MPCGGGHPDEFLGDCRRVVVISPHMDDGELACGGTIARFGHKEGLHCIYLSDGQRSPAPVLPSHRPDPGLGEVRRAESRAALAALGVPGANLHFLPFPEADLGRHRRRLATALAPLLVRLAPDALLIPFRYDRHPDHLVAHQVAGELARRLRLQARIFEYFVYFQWRLLPAGDVRSYIDPQFLHRVDIAPVQELKRQALDCHLTQVSRYYPWQDLPVLSGELLDRFCTGPEIFLRASDAPGGSGVFPSARLLIQLAHYLEPRLKRGKDRARLAFYGLRHSGPEKA